MVLQLRTTNKFTVIERKDDNAVKMLSMNFSKDGSSSSAESREEAEKWCVFSSERKSTSMTHPTSDFPIMEFMELIDSRNQAVSSQKLWCYLEKFGFAVLAAPSSSEAAQIVRRLQDTMEEDFFPGVEGEQINCAGLSSGDFPYISERGVPMYRLGYEYCDDGIREVYRVHCGSPDSQPWPTSTSQTNTSSCRQDFLRAMCLCRYICDVALHLTLGYEHSRRRKGSGRPSWKSAEPPPSRRRGHDNTIVPYYARPYGTLPDRVGDYSVMYAMHYFNSDGTDDTKSRSILFDEDDDTPLNVKSHVDPSLFVLEPYLSKVEGLQIRPTNSTSEWITVDGISSHIQQWLREQQVQHRHGVRHNKNDSTTAVDEVHPMVLFIGRAFAQVAKTRCGRNVSPTLHRVISPPCNLVDKQQQRRRIVTIYEQKYEEYFPPPVLD